MRSNGGGRPQQGPAARRCGATARRPQALEVSSQLDRPNAERDRRTRLHDRSRRQARPHRRRRQQAVDLLGDRAGGGGGGRAPRAHLSQRAARRERPRAGGDARQPARAAVRRRRATSRSRTSRATLDREFGGLDFLVHGAAFAPADALKNPFAETSREGFRIALDVSAYSLIGLTRAVAPLMEKRGGGSILTLTYLGSERVFTNYNVMGVAKAALESSVRYLAADLGPKNIRVNAISAGADQDAGGGRHLRASRRILQVYRERAPLRRGVEHGGSRRRGRVPAQPGGARRHRRNPDGRRRLPRHRQLGSQTEFSSALTHHSSILESARRGDAELARAASASRRPAPAVRRRNTASPDRGRAPRARRGSMRPRGPRPVVVGRRASRSGAARSRPRRPARAAPSSYANSSGVRAL